MSPGHRAENLLDDFSKELMVIKGAKIVLRNKHLFINMAAGEMQNRRSLQSNGYSTVYFLS